jgi:hypothetical protein
MPITHMWTVEVRDDMLESLDADDMFTVDELRAIAAAIGRLPLDSLVSMSDEEWEFLNTTEIPIQERSDVALAFLVADLIYGPGQWFDSQSIGESMGEWFTKD